MRVSCPRSVAIGCRGALSARLDRARSRFGAGERYSLRPGRSATVAVDLPGGQVAAARRRGARVRVRSVERGVHGPKTTQRSLAGAPAMKIAGRLFLLALLATLVLAGPASAATPVIAAFEKYVPGSGFDIGLVNAQTGRTLLVPSSVNTAADEFHPALTPDGRFLVFTRATLVSQPDGDVVPPASRELLMLDRQSGGALRPPFSVTQPPAAGATIVPTGTSGAVLAAGIRVPPPPPPGGPTPPSPAVVTAGTLSLTSPPSFVSLRSPRNDQGAAGRRRELSVRDVRRHPARRRALADRHQPSARHHGIRFNEGDGSIAATNSFLVDERGGGSPQTKVLTANMPRHATPRVPDSHVALDTTTSSGADIATIQWPGDSAPSALGTPVNTSAPERMPAWSPDGVQLGFVRSADSVSATSRRRLLVFDSTTGIQDVLNPAVDLGTEAPTAQLREFQATWGGLSLANTSGADSVVVSCLLACSGGLSGPTSSGVTLSPTLTSSTFTRVGILIARVVGTRRLFGRRVLRVRSSAASRWAWLATAARTSAGTPASTAGGWPRDLSPHLPRAHFAQSSTGDVALDPLHGSRRAGSGRAAVGPSPGHESIGGRHASTKRTRRQVAWARDRGRDGDRAGHGRRGGPDRRLRQLRARAGVRHRVGQREHGRGAVRSRRGQYDRRRAASDPHAGRPLSRVHADQAPAQAQRRHRSSGHAVAPSPRPADWHAHLAQRERGSGPGFGAGGSILAWGIRPVQNAAQRTDVSQRASFSNGLQSSTVTDIGSPPTTPSGQVLETPHAAVAKMTQSNTPVTARYLSFALLDANSGALQTGVAHLTTKFDAGLITNGSSNSLAPPAPRRAIPSPAAATTTRRSTWPTATTSTSRRSRGPPRRS